MGRVNRLAERIIREHASKKCSESEGSKRSQLWHTLWRHGSSRDPSGAMLDKGCNESSRRGVICVGLQRTLRSGHWSSGTCRS